MKYLYLSPLYWKSHLNEKNWYCLTCLWPCCLITCLCWDNDFRVYSQLSLPIWWVSAYTLWWCVLKFLHTRSGFPLFEQICDHSISHTPLPDCVAHSVTCLATDASLTADPGVELRGLDPGLVPYFRGDWSWNNFYGHFLPFRWIIQEGLMSVYTRSTD